MAKCDLAISVEGDAQALRPGDTFAGHVTIGADADVRCDALTLELRWVTDGKGSEDSKVIQSWNLFAGDLRTGTRQAYPFVARIPRWGPATYRGKILQVEWELRARADVPWAIDAKATLPLAVVNRAAPGAKDDEDDEDDEELDGPDDDHDEDENDDEEDAARADDLHELKLVVPGRAGNTWKPKRGLVIAVVLAVALAIALAFGLWRPMWGMLQSLPRLVRGDVTWADAPNLFFGLLILGFGAVVAWAIARDVMIRKRFGDVYCEIEPDTLRPGDEVRCVVRFTPRSSMDLSGITARLRAIEHCERGSGKNHRTYEHVALEQNVELSTARAVSPGLPYEGRGALQLPADAPLSFWASDNELQWKVEVAIRVARWPDWTRETALSVVP